MDMERRYLSIDELAERWSKNRKHIIEEIVCGGLTPSFFADDLECYQCGAPMSDTVFLSGEFSFNPPHQMLMHESFAVEAAIYIGDIATGNNAEGLSSKSNVFLFVEPVNLTTSEIMIPVNSLVRAYEKLFELRESERAQVASKANTVMPNGEYQDYPPLLAALPDDFRALYEAMGAGELPHLEALTIAWRKFWKNADPNDRTTCPKKLDVEAWLINQGLKEVNARAGATIIKPQWAREKNW